MEPAVAVKQGGIGAVELGGIRRDLKVRNPRAVGGDRFVLTHHEKHLKQLFDCFKKGDKASGDVQRAGSADGRTMSVDEFETFCAAASICPDMLPYTDPRTIFVALNLDDDLYEQEDKYLLRTAL